MSVEDQGAAQRQGWPLARILGLLVALGYLGTAGDVRLEHVDVVRENWEGWIPIAYASFMTVVGLAAVFWWRVGTRRVYFWLNFLSFIVGGLGFWFHNHGRLFRPFTEAAGAWYQQMKHPHGPPAFAPLLFWGFGALGLLATAKRFQPPGER